MWRWVSFGFLLPLCAFGQLQLTEYDGTTANPGQAGLSRVGSVAPGDTLTPIRFRVYNESGTGAASFTSLPFAGQGFSIVSASAPSLPYVIAPGAFASFSVAFSPTGVGSYSANLLVNSIAVTLSLGSATASATLWLGQTPLSAGKHDRFRAGAGNRDQYTQVHFVEP